MKKNVFILIVIFSTILSGCMSISVKDINSKPLSNVTFSTDNAYNSKNEKYDIKIEMVSNNEGKINLMGKLFKDGKLRKDGYITLNINNRGDYTLYKIDDFFSDNFLSNKEYEGLQKKIGNFAVVIENTAYYKNAIMKLKKIDIYEFKQKKYIELSFQSRIVYNDLKVDKYQVGKNLYSEILVKLLDYLVLIDDEKIDGVKLSITGFSKSFLDEFNESKPIEFEFIMNKENIKMYKDKDITSQKLLDESIILMDNERIELKLQ